MGGNLGGGGREFVLDIRQTSPALLTLNLEGTTSQGIQAASRSCNRHRKGSLLRVLMSTGLPTLWCQLSKTRLGLLTPRAARQCFVLLIHLILEGMLVHACIMCASRSWRSPCALLRQSLSACSSCCAAHPQASWHGTPRLLSCICPPSQQECWNCRQYCIWLFLWVLWL